ncbi:MAG: Glycerophosphoryl diester phosphodiesterase [uncultured Thermomicrobiales bacterium]|uniref:Glycerophosphoryl diester phosphodiesterase n=1 Tax=uncultured Thermomicrobiales bacterium TaxID=1645740 RepID=A0A6J4UBW3_9BACT|nr:MAG: Glycerophosphoryl diester phosphodiesterase [uncultured Thermomicrobiales bacterium]
MLVYAHRGASGEEPENTLRAFRRALDVGSDGIELDVRTSADGIPVVIHDRDISRTTDGMGMVDEMSLDQLRTLDAGSGERVPTLEDVLDLVGDRAALYIEIKGVGCEGAVLDVLRAHPAVRATVASFDDEILRTVRTCDRDVEIWVIAIGAADETMALAAEVGATTLSLQHLGITADTVRDVEAAGHRVAAWTVNDIPEAARLADLGVTAICTDHPARLIPALRAVPGPRATSGGHRP